MGDSYLFRGLKPFERRLIYLSCLGILFCLYLLRFHNFSNLNNGQAEKEIGYLAETQSDIRIKNYAQTLWQSAQKNQKVREGDKVYTGAKSFATISLMNESRIELKENSLVEFKKLNNQNIANLDEGEYRVAVLKDLKIAIKGQIASIEGSSEIILKVDKNKNISVETLKGTPTIQYQSKTYSPTKESQLDIAHLQPEPLTEVSAATPIQVSLESKNYDYYLKLYDVYDRIGSQLKLKDKSTQLVRLKVPLTIETFDSSSEILVEYSNQKDFSDSRRFSVDSLDRSLPQVYLGDNYWHCSQNEKDWSSKAHFHVRALVLPTSQVSARFDKQTLYLRDGLAEVDVHLSTQTTANGFLVESSRKPLFDSGATTYWSYQSQLHLKFTQPGKYYYRFRAVDEDLRLGEWSETTTVDVNESANLIAPQFARQDYKTTSGESLLLSWNNPDKMKNFKVKIFNTTEEKIVEKVVTNPFLRWTPKNAGNYYAEVQSIDPYQHLSEPGTASITVKAIEVRVTESESSQGGGKGAGETEGQDGEDRDVASEISKDDLDVKMQYPVIQLGFNADFILSRFTFSTNYYDGFNSKALADARVAPIATPGLQATGLKWYDHHGLEGLIQKNLTSNEPGSADFYTLEGRYHYRFYDSQTRADNVGFHISPFVGYEMYSNSNFANFLSKYSLLKVGVFFELPLMNSWTLGLTGVYGTGDSLTKYEAMWDMAYFFKKQWAMGVGLKTSILFGTSDEFPLYPDYREGYSLGQFNLRYFF